MPPPPEPPRPVFKLKPDRMSLSPGQSQEVILEGFSDKYIHNLYLFQFLALFLSVPNYFIQLKLRILEQG